MTVRNWSAVASNNNSSPPYGSPEGQAPSSLNNVIRQVMADVRDSFEQLPYFDFGHTPTRVDNDTFTVATDLTATYYANRRVKLVGATTGYATVSSSSYSAPDTTVNVVMDSGNVPTSLSTVSVGPDTVNAPTLSTSIKYDITTAETGEIGTPSNFNYQFGNVKRFGTGTDVGALIQAAVNAGCTSIYVPPQINWVWTTPVVLPNLWRGVIYSDKTISQAWTISAKCGHNYPMIDAQGALFVGVVGLNVTATDSSGTAPACFIALARMLSGASSSNHYIANNVAVGQFYYCVLYNVGAEELVFENNYFALYSTTNTIQAQTAPVVHQLNENAYFSAIVTKEARTNGTSTSAIQHRGDVIKNQNTNGGSGGGSAIYIGENCNDILLDLAYGYTADNSNFLYLNGYFDGIRLGADRVETTKNSPIVSAPNGSTAGTIALYKGAYRRSGAVNSAKYAVDIGGTTSHSVNVIIDKSVSFTGTYGGGTEDIYILRSTRKTAVDIDLSCATTEETFTNSLINIATLMWGKIHMGRSANLTVTTYFGPFEGHFYYDNASSKAAHWVKGGAIVTGRPLELNAKFGSYEAANSTSDSTSNSIHYYFKNPNGVVGSISTSGTATAYTTSSDERLKIVKGSYSNSGSIIDAAHVVNFEWKYDGNEDIGFLAQELYSIFPTAVHVGGENPKENPWGVDHSKLVPVLVAELQSVRQRLKKLEDK